MNKTYLQTEQVRRYQIKKNSDVQGSEFQPCIEKGKKEKKNKNREGRKKGRKQASTKDRQRQNLKKVITDFILNILAPPNATIINSSNKL